MAKTLQQIKDEYAKEIKYSSWNAIPIDGNYTKRIDQIAIRYSQEQNKELLDELEQVVKTIENVSTLGNICDLADHAKQLINKHKGGKS